MSGVCESVCGICMSVCLCEMCVYVCVSVQWSEVEADEGAMTVKASASWCASYFYRPSECENGVPRRCGNVDL